MEKKKALGNLGLLLILILLIIIIYVIFGRQSAKQENNEVNLVDIGYSSDVNRVGYRDAKGILNNYIEGYNTSDGEKVLGMMDLIALYIYQEVDCKDEDFDAKYEEILSNPGGYKDLILMQKSAEKYEKEYINEINNDSPTLTLMENSEIQDVTKYLSKMTAKIKIVSEKEGIDEVSDVQFILLHREDTYYVIDSEKVFNEE